MRVVEHDTAIFSAQLASVDKSGGADDMDAPAQLPLKVRRPLLFAIMLYTILVVVQLMFSGYHVIGKVALNGALNPLIFSFYRDLTCTSLMLVVTWWLDGKPALPWRTAPRLAVLGATVRHPASPLHVS
jgi:hypothetical protein